MNHLQACEYCPKYDDGCTVYEDTAWVNRRGGCPGFPYRAVPRIRGEYVDGEIVGVGRVGQQHQKSNDRSYNNAKAKRKYRRKTV